MLLWQLWQFPHVEKETFRESEKPRVRARETDRQRGAVYTVIYFIYIYVYVYIIYPLLHRYTHTCIYISSLYTEQMRILVGMILLYFTLLLYSTGTSSNNNISIIYTPPDYTMLDSPSITPYVYSSICH